MTAPAAQGGSLRGYGHAVLAAFWSAVMIVVSKWAMREIDPVSLAALIMSAGAFATAAWITARRGWSCVLTLRGDGWKWALGLSFFFVVIIVASLYAISLMDATVVAFVSRVETLVAILLGVWFFSERFTRKEAVGAVFVAVGVVVLRYAGGIAIERGFWIALSSSIGFGVAEAMAKKTVSIVDPFAFALFRNIVLGVSCSAIALARPTGFNVPQETLGWLAVVGIGISGPFLGRVHFLKALQMIHISKTALVGQALPIWVALLSYFVLQTVPSQREWLGGCVVILGCTLLIIGRGRSPGDERANVSGVLPD